MNTTYKGKEAQRCSAQASLSKSQFNFHHKCSTYYGEVSNRPGRLLDLVMAVTVAVVVVLACITIAQDNGPDILEQLNPGRPAGYGHPEWGV